MPRVITYIALTEVVVDAQPIPIPLKNLPVRSMALKPVAVDV